MREATAWRRALIAGAMVLIAGATGAAVSQGGSVRAFLVVAGIGAVIAAASAVLVRRVRRKQAR